MDQSSLQSLLDRAEIQDCMSRYARGVDRGDWELVRAAYHQDAQDQHGDYKGNIEGLIEWLNARFAGVDNSMHFLGNCLIEFAGPDHAFVETYFCSRRLRLPTETERPNVHTGDMFCRESWGRYLDHFERRNRQWRVAQRTVVLESSSTSLAIGGARTPALTWGSRDRNDLVYATRDEVSAKAASARA